VDVILQSEAAECGLACLAMAANHHGQQIELRELRRRFSLSLKGANLSRIIKMASDMEFSTRPLRLELEELKQLKTPCILHWDLNHFVVLEKVSGNKITILDPAFGRRVLSFKEASGHFTGVALELTPTKSFQKKKEVERVSLSQLTGHITGIWRTLALILGLSLALQVFVIVSPMYMQWVVDQVLVSADRNLLTVLGIGFILLLFMQVAIGLVRGWTVVTMSRTLGMQWMQNVFSHLLKLPMDFFEKRHLGDITSRMGSVQTIQHTLTTSFVEAIIDGMMTIVTLAMMLYYSWKLALFTLVAVLIYAGLRAMAYRPMRTNTEKQLLAGAKQQSHLLESIRGIQSVKLAGSEPTRKSVYANLMNDTLNNELSLAKLGLGFNSANQLVFGLERIAVIWFGATLAMSNIFSVGMLIAYLSYKDQFTGRVAGLIDKAIEFRMLRLHGERLADIVLTEPDSAADGLLEVDNKDLATLSIKDLNFRYSEGDPWVIKDCHFAIPDGQAVAIVGVSGCGKTTLVKLMLGLLKPESGAIQFSGQDITQLGTANYRRHVGSVMQDDQLFAGSIADNISFFDENFDMARIEEAARMAAIHDEITAMPMAYHSLIGDMGTSLSGGQKQRVILARALYRQPKILFLDEATSHLDIHNERLVNDAVKQLNITKIIIAHRPETIASADRVLTMHEGRIVHDSANPQEPVAETEVEV